MKTLVVSNLNTANSDVQWAGRQACCNDAVVTGTPAKPHPAESTMHRYMDVLGRKENLFGFKIVVTQCVHFLPAETS
jgi:hypothetical protein